MMLNTDLHNKNVHADKKMKVEEFIRNLRGTAASVLHLTSFCTDVNTERLLIAYFMRAAFDEYVNVWICHTMV